MHQFLVNDLKASNGEVFMRVYHAQSQRGGFTGPQRAGVDVTFKRILDSIGARAEPASSRSAGRVPPSRREHPGPSGRSSRWANRPNRQAFAGR